MVQLSFRKKLLVASYEQFNIITEAYKFNRDCIERDLRKGKISQEEYNTLNAFNNECKVTLEA